MAHHLASLPWSCFFSATSGMENQDGGWRFVPKSRAWWIRSIFGWMRGACALKGASLASCRFVVRFENSEQQGLLHVHVLLWTGGPWTITDAMMANALWRRPGNGTRHCTPYQSSLAGAWYICKGLEMPELGGLSYEIAKTALIDTGCLMLDDNTVSALQAGLRQSRPQSWKPPSSGQLASARGRMVAPCEAPRQR